MKVKNEDDAHSRSTAHGHKKINESTFKGSIMFSKNIVNHPVMQERLQKKVSMKVTAVTFPNAVRDFAVHKVIIFLVEAL